MITKLNIIHVVILTICIIYNIIYVCINIIVFLFGIDSINDSTMHISWCNYYILYNIKIICVYKIRCSQQNMHPITVDFPQINISHLLIMYNNSLLLSKKLYV